MKKNYINTDGTWHLNIRKKLGKVVSNSAMLASVEYQGTKWKDKLKGHYLRILLDEYLYFLTAFIY